MSFLANLISTFFNEYPIVLLGLGCMMLFLARACSMISKNKYNVGASVMDSPLDHPFKLTLYGFASTFLFFAGIAFLAFYFTEIMQLAWYENLTSVVASFVVMVVISKIMLPDMMNDVFRACAMPFRICAMLLRSLNAKSADKFHAIMYPIVQFIKPYWEKVFGKTSRASHRG